MASQDLNQLPVVVNGGLAGVISRAHVLQIDSDESSATVVNALEPPVPLKAVINLLVMQRVPASHWLMFTSAFSIRTASFSHMKRQLHSVVKILFVENAADMTFDGS